MRTPIHRADSPRATAFCGSGHVVAPRPTAAERAGVRTRGAMRMLQEAIGRIERLPPAQAWAEAHTGRAHLIDVRTPRHRADQGELPGALVIDLTVLEWRLDPSSPWRIPEADAWDRRWIIACRHGYSSALAADRLTRMGLTRVADLAGGVAAWEAAQLPLLIPGTTPVDVRP